MSRRATAMLDLTIELPDGFEDLDQIRIRLDPEYIRILGADGLQSPGAWGRRATVESLQFIASDETVDLTQEDDQ